MIIAGIDEAGLGPALGPLCTAGAAFRLERPPADAAAPWELYRNVFGRSPKDSLPPVNDSKVIHAARGTAGLELPVLAFLAARAAAAPALPPGREALLQALGAAIPPDDRAPWLDAADDWRLPAFAAPEAVAASAAAIRATPGIRPLALAARVRTAKALNREFATGHNKAETAWQSVAALVRQFAALEPGQEETLIVVDKQGGRHFYAGQVAELFACPLVETLREGPSESAYRVRHCQLVFRPRADREAFPVALASMTAKYLRERLMEDFNRWFAARVPGLRPTAGYHGDAPRFYSQVRATLQRHHIGIGDFWRQR